MLTFVYPEMNFVVTHEQKKENKPIKQITVIRFDYVAKSVGFTEEV